MTGRKATSRIRCVRGSQHEQDGLGHLLRAHQPGQGRHVGRAPAAHGEVGRDATGADVRAADALLAQLVVEGPRQPDLGELRRAVDRLVREAAPAGLAGQRDDVGRVAREQVREGRPDGVDGALHVDLDHLVEVLGREVEDRAVRADTGVHEHDVEPAVTIDDGIDRRTDLVGVAHVGRHPDRAGNAEVVARARHEAELHARHVEHAGGRGTDAAACSGDQGHAPVQALHHRPSLAPEGLSGTRSPGKCPGPAALLTRASAMQESTTNIWARGAQTG